jgi:hypothetical protein
VIQPEVTEVQYGLIKFHALIKIPFDKYSLYKYFVESRNEQH